MWVIAILLGQEEVTKANEIWLDVTIPGSNLNYPESRISIFVAIE